MTVKTALTSVKLLTKVKQMASRFRIEIYDDIKSNDLTLYSDQGVDREFLTEYVFSNINNFTGKIRAYVYDNVKKKKVTAMFLNEEIVAFAKSKSAGINKVSLG